MQIKRYLISAPPRSGGNLVEAILHSCRTPVIHTHDPRCRLDYYEYTGLIILRRRDIFAAAMSNCIVWATGQDINYPKQQLDPIEVSEQDFINQVAVQVQYRDSHDFSRPYGAIYEFDFEDIIRDQHLVVERLGLDQDPELLHLKQLNNPAPYNYKQVIKNHEKLFALFQTLSLDSLANPFANTYGTEYADYNGG